MSLVREVTLKVAEAKPWDVGKSIARIDGKVMSLLGLSVGDVVEIEGKKSTVATVASPYPEDWGQGIIRIDALLRKSAEISLGEVIKIRKAVKVDRAKRIVLAPLEASLEDISREFVDYVKSRLKATPLCRGSIIEVPLLRTSLKFIVVSTAPPGVVQISDVTEVIIRRKPEQLELTIPKVTYEDIGGLEEVKCKVREMVEFPLRYPEVFKRLGVQPPKGVLFYGPPGTGKTLLAKAVANESGAYFIAINGPEIVSKYYGESEARLREIFKAAKENAPAIIFIDEIDAIAPKREEVGEVERRIVAQLLTLMDGLEEAEQVVVIATTNRINDVDPALRRPGRFDREIFFPVPDKKARREILAIHTRNMPLAKDVDLDEIAALTHGYTGADLAALCREAAMNALRRVLPKINFSKGEIPPEVLEEIEVTRRDFMEALKDIQPTAMREVYVEVPEVHWENIGGLKEAKQMVREAVEWPIKHPEFFKEMGIDPPKGVLLYGPPGCGKTLLAKAAATESGANFISVKGPEILSKWVGESEKAVREIFARARQVAPCIIFFDEIDAIAPRRGTRFDSGVTDRIVNQLLTEMDGIEKLEGIVVLAATNRPDIIDPALLRPGRFDRLIYVPPPDLEARYEILKVHTRRMPLAEDVDLKKIAERTELYSGADLAALCREAAMTALREAGKPTKVHMRHFEKAMKVVKPSLKPEDLERYEKIREELTHMFT
ncbi:MAG: AAA family ATPase [Thermoprotei archaeon]|nr:MAG: AAA family ATPase [Thermoprotei archaeon]